MKTELEDRILWHDGTNQVKPEMVPALFLHGVPQERIFVTELNEDIIKFNQLADDTLQIDKRENGQFDFSWNIPEEYQKIDIAAYVKDRLRWKMKAEGISQDHLETYGYRIYNEMAQIKAFEVEPLFRTLIYIVEKLKQEGKVWGVGRGSSCASLILHLIGVHEVDPVKYNIPLTEFFHA